MGTSYGSLHIRGSAKLIRTPEASLIYGTMEFVGSVLFFSTVLSLSYLGMFGLIAFSNRYYIARNPWIKEIKKIEPWVSKGLLWFNPVYFSWLYQKDRKKWLYYVSIIDLMTSIIIGICAGVIWYQFKLLTFLLRGEAWPPSETLIMISGFMCSLIVLIFIAVLLKRYQLKKWRR